MPELADLTPAQVDKIAQGVVVDELKAEMRRAIVAERVDWQAEREAFLSDAKSTHTREAYARALDHLGNWLELHNLPAANLTPRLADDFIRDLRAMSGRDADSTRLVVSACTSFFTFLERRFDEIRNPFRGSRARPASTWTEAVIPTAAELEVLQAAAEPPSPRPWRWPSRRGFASGDCRGSRFGRTGPGTPSRRRTACTPLSRSLQTSAKPSRLRGWIPAGRSPRRASRGARPDGRRDEGQSRRSSSSPG